MTETLPTLLIQPLMAEEPEPTEPDPDPEPDPEAEDETLEQP